jgi:hypothetical protein
MATFIHKWRRKTSDALPCIISGTTGTGVEPLTLCQLSWIASSHERIQSLSGFKPTVIRQMIGSKQSWPLGQSCPPFKLCMLYYINIIFETKSVYLFFIRSIFYSDLSCLSMTIKVGGFMKNNLTKVQKQLQLNVYL